MIDQIEKHDLLAHATTVGDRLRTALAQVPGVAGVRGRGLLLGIVLESGGATPDAKTVEARCRRAGVLVNAIGDDLVRLAPPLILDEDQADLAATVLGEAITA